MEKCNNFLKNVELVEAFRSLDETEISVDYLSSMIFNRIGIMLNTGNLGINKNELKPYWGNLCCKQYPDELAKLLVFLYKHRIEINSYIEIGVERGGTFYTIDSFLRAMNPNFQYSLAVDIDDNMVRNHGFKEYKDKIGTCDFLKMNSMHFVPDRSFDLCFIDGDHSYSGVKADYEKMKSKTNKFIVFHDIEFGEVGVPGLWNEIVGEKIEFLTEDKRFPVSLGIGIVKV